MRSSITLNFLVLSACRGLTLTRDENIAVSMTGAAVSTTTFDTHNSYPKNGATGIHTSAPITLAWKTFTAAEYMYAPTAAAKYITVTCSKCVPDGTCTPGTDCQDDVRKFLNSELQVSTFTPAGVGATATRNGYATINSLRPWYVGTHTVTMQAGALVNVNDKDASTDTLLAVPHGITYTFVTQESCEKLTTKALCNPPKSPTDATNTRPDCMWTGDQCEADVVVVAGGTVNTAAASGVGGAWAANGANAANGIQWLGTGVSATAGRVECANGIYTAAGMHDGKPYYSRGLLAVKDGGSSLSYEKVSTVNGFRAAGVTGAGWVLVCDGGPRYQAAVEDVQVAAAATWTKVTDWATSDALTVTQASCTKPLGEIAYGWATVQPDNSLARGSFGPDISCAPGYSGSAKATNCAKNGEAYKVSGCTKNSSRRRRRKHSHPWSNNKNDAAPWNPWAWWR